MKTIRTYTLKAKITSLILAFLIIFYLVPVSVFAEGIGTDTGGEESSPEMSSAADYTIDKEVYEVTELREENVKHFRLEDGTYLAASYNNAVHYMDEHGEWQDIDNRLFSVGTDYSNSNARIKFVKKITGSGKLFSLADGDGKLDMSVIGANKGIYGIVTNNEDSEEDTELQKKMNLENLSSSVLYEEVFDGVDIEYVVHSLNVKENIIVKERAESYSYSFELKLSKLTPELCETGDVLIYDESGNVKYTIPAPVVYDSAVNVAPKDKAKYTLTGENGKYVLTVSVDSEWMNAEERAFPVIVDPTVGVSNSQILDLYTYANSPTSSYATSSTLLVGANYLAYWKSFVIPSFPEYSHITSASVTFHATSDSSVGCRVGAYKLTEYWDDDTTWNNRPAIESEPIDYIYISETNTLYTLDITSIISEWYSGRNFGICLKPLSGYENYGIARFASNDSTEQSQRPILQINYVDIRGAEDYWAYSSQSAGVGGNVSINLASGNMVLAIPTLSTTDSLMSYTPTLVYNSYMANTSYGYSSASIPFTSSYLGNGFKLNVLESVIKKNLTLPGGESASRYTYVDADGTEHYFLPDSENAEKYVDEDGLQLELTESSGKVTITDTNTKWKREFVSTTAPSSSILGAWYLNKIVDNVGNAIVFTFKESPRSPITVSFVPNGSTSIDMLQLSYNSSGKLQIVYNCTSLDAVIFRYSSTYNGAISTSSSNYLRRIDYAHGTENATVHNLLNFASSESNMTNVVLDSTALYTYDSSGRVVKIEDTLSNQSLWYNYTDEKVTSVQHYSGSTLGQTIKYTYGTKYTDVTSSGNDDVIDTNDDTVTRYIFDNRGRAVSVYSFAKNNSEIYGATVGVYETQDNIKNNLKEQTVLKDTSVNYLVNGSFESRTNDMFTDWNIYGNVTCTSVSFPNSGIYGAYIRPLSSETAASISQKTELEAGKYTLSFVYGSYYVNGAIAHVTVYSESGFYHTEDIPIEASPNSTRSYFITSFEIPQDTAVTVKIELTKNYSTSIRPSLTVDQVMLEKRTGASRYSYVMDGGFESPSYGTGNTVILYSEYWKARYCTPEIVYTGELFGNSLKIPARASESYVTQRVYSNYFSELNMGNTGQYLISGYAFSPSAMDSFTGIFRLRVDVTYYQGNNKDDVVKSFYYDFVPGCTDWQFAGGLLNTAYIPEAGDANIYNYVTAIDVICEFSHQPDGYAYFDNISFVSVSEKDSLKYRYDEAGRMVQKSTYFNNEYYFYNGTSRNPQRVANDDGEIWDYTYDNAGNVLTEKYYTFVRTSGGGTLYPNYEYIINPETGEPYTPEQIGEFNPENYIVKTGCYGTTYTYNTYGLCTSVKTYAIDSSGNAVSSVKSMIRSTKYNVTAGSKIFGSVKEEISYEETSVHYYYDQNDGKLLASVNYNGGYGTAYTYDGMGNLIGAIPAQYYGITDFYRLEGEESVSYTYDAYNRLSAITTDSTTYTFTYDAFGNTTSADAGNYELASYEYNPNNGKLKKLTYSNGLTVEYFYNSLENLSEVWYTKGTTRTLAYEYEYTADGKLHSLKNNLSGRTEIYKYDANGRVIGFAEYDNEELEFTHSTEYYYNDEGQLSSEYQYLRYLVGSDYSRNILSYSYTYNSHGNLTQYRISNSASGTVDYTYDALDRLSSKSFVSGSFSNTTSYTYSDKSSSTSPTQLKNYTVTVNGTAATYKFYYDGFGNVDTVIYGTGERVYYTYDKLSQLIREDNGLLGETYVYTYDKAGNIIKKETFALTSSSTTPTNPTSTKTYTYGDSTWGDRLTKYNGVTITYDSIGNPLSYYNGTSYNFTWTGRQLTSATKGGVTYTFTYNDEGIRTSKSANGNTTTYYYSAGLLIGESDNTQTILYIYDAEGSPLGLRYRTHTQSSGSWTTYWFEKNMFGDVVAVYNSSGTKLVSYKYDAWGNFTTTTHAADSVGGSAKNPFKYRGYYYDSDLRFYVTGTRYYDPAIGRFISPDSVMSGASGALRGSNLYVYCFNNPVMLTDENGNWPEWLEAAWNVIKALGESIEFELGYGVGGGVTADLVIAGIPAGAELMYVVTDSIVCDDGKWDTVHRTHFSIGASFCFFDLGASVGESHSFNDPLCTCTTADSLIEKSVCPAQTVDSDVALTYGFEYGAFIGGGVLIGLYINLTELERRLNEVFSE